MRQRKDYCTCNNGRGWHHSGCAAWVLPVPYVHPDAPAPLPEQAPVSPGMGKGESKAQGRAHLCITFKQGSARCDVCGDRLAVNVPRETLERVVEAMARPGKCDWCERGGVVIGMPKHGERCVRSVLAELRGLMEGE